MFKVKHDCCPTVLSNLFRDNKSVHNYCTRQADQFHVPVAKRNYQKSAKGNKFQRSAYMELYKSVHRLWSILHLIQNRNS